jgi:DDE superfamily endonuclease
MLTPSLPCSLADLLKALRPCFTAPTFRTFQALVGGFLAQPGLRTVTGMLVGAGLAGRWHHARAHRFFAAARWQADQLGLAVGGLIVARLLDAAAPIRLVADDSLFNAPAGRCSGPAGTTMRPRRVASAPPGATTGSSSACWCARRLCPTGWCACRCRAACGSLAGPATASSTWRANSSG